MSPIEKAAVATGLITTSVVILAPDSKIGKIAAVLIVGVALLWIWGTL